jgi:hypothetical protein
VTTKPALAPLLPLEASPVVVARVGGALYLVIIALGIFAEMGVRARVLVAGDALQTAANLRAHEQLWRWGIAAELLGLVCVAALLFVWVVLLSPVSRQLTWLALSFVVIAHTVQVVAIGDLLAALFPLAPAKYLEAFTPEQLAALARLSARAHGHGFGLSLLFTGCFFVVAGYLIRKSGYLPRFVGALYQIAGIGYIANTFVLVLAPAWSGKIFLPLLPVILAGELSLSVWLLTKGVDREGWRSRQAPS